jgi:chemotaxis-related protein WspD
VEPLNPSPEPALPAAVSPGPASTSLTAMPREIVDCWNKIGVSGDGSCRELAAFVHCRNCPVYSAAGASLLDQALPADYRRNWTEHFSREKSNATPAKNSVVIFRIGAEWLALPTVAFQEVAERRKIHSLPHRRDSAALGLINVRGELLVCVSIGRLLGIEPVAGLADPRTVHHRLVIAEWQGNILTFPVDEIYGIHRYQPEELKAVPATVAGADASFTRGVLDWEGRMVGCLDAERVFAALNRSLA